MGISAVGNIEIGMLGFRVSRWEHRDRNVSISPSGGDEEIAI
jgi:hypothetical protein